MLLVCSTKSSFQMNPFTAAFTALFLAGGSAVGFSQATVAALNQNVLWAGIDNPVNITSVAAFNEVRLTGGTAHDLEFKGDRHAALSIVPDAGAESVSVALKLGDQAVTSAAVFRVRLLPQPAVRFGIAEQGDSLTQNELTSQALQAILPGVEEPVELTWKGFQLSTMVDGNINNYTSDSNQLTAEMKQALASAPSGTGIFFNRMAIETPDGQVHEAPNVLVFKR
jgi:hypothetical protein